MKQERISILFVKVLRLYMKLDFRLKGKGRRWKHTPNAPLIVSDRSLRSRLNAFFGGIQGSPLLCKIHFSKLEFMFHKVRKGLNTN